MTIIKLWTRLWAVGFSFVLTSVSPEPNKNQTHHPTPTLPPKENKSEQKPKYQIITASERLSSPTYSVNNESCSVLCL